MSRTDTLTRIDLPGSPQGDEWLEISIDPDNAFEESPCAIIIVHHMATGMFTNDGPLFLGENVVRAEAEVNMPVQTAIRLRNALDEAIAAADRVTVER